MALIVVAAVGSAFLAAALAMHNLAATTRMRHTPRPVPRPRPAPRAETAA
jgi:hypothetical protein